jgi:hypothetical protein
LREQLRVLMGTGTVPVEDNGDAEVTAVDDADQSDEERPTRSRRPLLDPSRYRDAYSVARSITGYGALLKAGGIAVGIGIIFLGIVSAAADRGPGAAAFFVGLIAGAIAGLSIYAFGVMVSAQSQILLAMLDTAVNTSPLADNRQKAAMLG